GSGRNISLPLGSGFTPGTRVPGSPYGDSAATVVGDPRVGRTPRRWPPLSIPDQTGAVSQSTSPIHTVWGSTERRMATGHCRLPTAYRDFPLTHSGVTGRLPNCGRGCSEREDPGVELGTLLERGAQGPVQSVLQVQGAPPLHHVREQVSVEGGVLREELVQCQLPLGGGELVQPHRPRRDLGPLLHRQPVGRVGSLPQHGLEDHLTRPPPPRRVRGVA